MSAVSVAEKETRRIPWWLLLIEGIALVILGLLWLSNPATTTIIFIQVLGIYWLIAGIFKLISIFLDHSMWGWKLVAGILGIIAGIIILQHPLWSTVVVGATLIIILGIQGIVFGGIGIYQAFKGAGWGTGILGVISIILGILLMGGGESDQVRVLLVMPVASIAYLTSVLIYSRAKVESKN